MKDRGSEDLEAYLEMVRDSLESTLNQLKLNLGDPVELSRELLASYRRDILEVLDMPFGGALSPGEYAEMVLLRFFEAQPDHEAAATWVN